MKKTCFMLVITAIFGWAAAPTPGFTTEMAFINPAAMGPIQADEIDVDSVPLGKEDLAVLVFDSGTGNCLFCANPLVKYPIKTNDPFTVTLKGAEYYSVERKGDSLRVAPKGETLMQISLPNSNYSKTFKLGPDGLQLLMPDSVNFPLLDDGDPVGKVTGKMQTIKTDSNTLTISFTPAIGDFVFGN